MRPGCNCKWEGALDGRIKRCGYHSKLYEHEKYAKKCAKELFEQIMDEFEAK